MACSFSAPATDLGATDVVLATYPVNMRPNPIRAVPPRDVISENSSVDYILTYKSDRGAKRSRSLSVSGKTMTH